jgi:ABC-type transporter Mla subunit MlaD
MDQLTIFIAVTAAAVVLQACVMLGMFLAVRKTTARMEALAEEVKSKVLPAVDTAQSVLTEFRPTLTELRPKIDTAVTNVAETTTMIRAQLQRIDATVTDLVDRSRLQVIRADDMVTRTLDKVEETTEMVKESVVSPVRRLNGMIHGVTAALDYLTHARKRDRGVTVPQDEMFI